MAAMDHDQRPPDTVVDNVAVAARQPSLHDALAAGPAIDRDFVGATRHDLADGAWVEHVPAWVTGSDELFGQVVAAARWRIQTMRMYDDVVTCPRLSTAWTLAELPDDLSVVRVMAATISRRHRVALTRVSANLYRDGRDSVAWHGDRGARDVTSATVAVLSLGATRPFRLRQRDGHGRLDLAPRAGDLVVMGGTCQRTWQHCVPKVASAGPRISIMFRPAAW